MPRYVGAAALFSVQNFGGICEVEPTVIPVGLASVPVIPADPERVSWLLFNIGTTQITIMPATPVVSGTGLILLTTGSFFSMKVRDDGDAVALPWWAIGNAAGGNLLLIASSRVERVAVGQE